MPAGRPLKFQSVEELQEKIEEYFSKCKTEGKKPIISGLALHLDTTRETLCDYRDKDEYSYSIKRAKQRCEAILEENLVEGKVNPTGTIFNLKNNYGWKDKTEQDVDVTSGGKPIYGSLSRHHINEENIQPQEEN